MNRTWFERAWISVGALIAVAAAACAVIYGVMGLWPQVAVFVMSGAASAFTTLMVIRETP